MTQKERIIEKVSIMIKDCLTTWVLKHPEIAKNFKEKDFEEKSNFIQELMNSKKAEENPAECLFDILEMFAKMEIEYEDKK
jgi:hypothetical protein